jgi:hypothetical protein
MRCSRASRDQDEEDDKGRLEPVRAGEDGLGPEEKERCGLDRFGLEKKGGWAAGLD